MAARDELESAKWLIKRDGQVTFSDWFFSGWAFEDSVAQAAAWDAASELPAITKPGTLHSGPLAKNLQGAARSPTFMIPGAQVHIRAKGQGQVRLVVDNYMLDEVHKLLFDGLIHKVDTAR